ncbi:MAG: amidohydrolase family protein [Planctomycetes bacterium]|nr:amidohydrolase family protein [Planctomycetota bacterium]
MERIDAHLHFTSEHPDYAVALAEWNLKLLNTVGSVEHPLWRERLAEPYRRLAQAYPERFGWITSFDLPGFGEREYHERVIARLGEDFANGALGCKIWKSFGMGLRDAAGAHVLVDHPILEPILSFIERSGKTLLMHIADPQGCWRPLGPDNQYSNFYSKYPDKYLYGRTDMPSHAELIASRDRVIERHPRLRVVGAHLGSLEYDVSELARRFERQPNFAVDTSGLARAVDLGLQDRNRVRRFFEDFPDRILFGSDVNVELHAAETPESRRQALEAMRSAHQSAFDFYETDRTLMLRERTLQGLGLSEHILKQLYAENARRWYPGL